MTAGCYIESIKSYSLSIVNARLKEICGISDFFHDSEELNDFTRSASDFRENQNAYGDWPTNMDLTLGVCRLLKKQGISPKVIVEPTCGKGNFVLAALQTFEDIEDIYGIEIYKPYLDELKIQLLQHYIDHPSERKVNIHLYHHDVFDFDFLQIKQLLGNRETLLLGNPPWVTNSKLGSVKIANLPQKNNFKKLGGIEALTGKANFDIAEFIAIKLIDSFAGENARFAFLLKNSVIRNILYEQKSDRYPVSDICQYTIDAKKEFGASVAASLLCFNFEKDGNIAKCCCVKDFYTQRYIQTYGWVNRSFVSNIRAYKKFQYLDGVSSLRWRSGLKHDCVKVMELTFDGENYFNGFGEVVDIEEDVIYPLIKSSDIKDFCIHSTRKYVIVTQQGMSDDTEHMRVRYPKAYRYLLAHARYLDGRASKIYKNRPRFSLFGIGKYSFMDYKVVVSGLYGQTRFSVVSPINGKPVMLDDTCYSLGFNRYDEALVICRMLNSSSVQSFIGSLLFMDAKRVLNKELLMRIDLLKGLKHITVDDVGDWQCSQIVSALKNDVIS